MGCGLCDGLNKSVFDQSPAERLDEAVRQDKSLLESSEEGWLMHYYAGKDYTGPSVTLLLKFQAGKVSILSERNPDQIYTSDYDVVKDQGPVLTVNTYNEALHSLASASLGRPDGIQGDYEFAVLSTSEGQIQLQGKKWKNQMTLTRLPKGTKWEEYMAAIAAIKDELTAETFTFKFGDRTLADGIINTSINRLAVTLDGKEFETPVSFTDKGIVLHTPLMIEGKAYTTFVWESEAKKFTSGELALELFRPSNYKTIDFWYGTWRVKHLMVKAPGVNPRKPTQLILEAPETPRDAENGLYKATLVYQDRRYPIAVFFDKARGAIKIPMQPISVNSPEAPAGIVLYPANKERIHIEQSEYGITFSWDEEHHRALPTGDNAPDVGVIDSFYGVGYEFKGNQRVPMIRDDKPVTPIAMREIEDLLKRN